jgi:hypothetical protein
MYDERALGACAQAQGTIAVASGDEVAFASVAFCDEAFSRGASSYLEQSLAK